MSRNMTIPAMVTAARIRKIFCHEKSSVRAPVTKPPRAVPRPIQPSSTPTASPRCARGNQPLTIKVVILTIRPNPIKKRKTIIIG